MGRAAKDRGAIERRPDGYYRVAGLDLGAEMARLASLPVFGGQGSPLARRLPTLNVRRASKRPKTFGFAIPDEWRISVTAYPGQRPGDAQETLLHELVHLFVGAPSGSRRWHGREFKTTLRRAMREGYGIGQVKVNGSYHGAYADALERRRAQALVQASRAPHPGQLCLELASV